MKKIVIYADNAENPEKTHAGELISKVKKLHMDAEIIVLGIGSEDTADHLQWRGVTTAVITGIKFQPFQEDATAQAVIAFLKEYDPDYILIPAMTGVKSIFARAAASLNAGMTADITEIIMDKDCLKGKKPAFGDRTMVITSEAGKPAVLSIVTGLEASEPQGPALHVELFPVHSVPSGVELVDIEDETSDSIVTAHHIIAVGKGLADPSDIELAKSLAGKMDAALGATRPLVDSGLLPFNTQIGQTGYVVHPETCLFFGISGAIQHTEGVKDTKLTIAVNKDPHAAIFTFADYGVVDDAREVMKALLEKME